MRPPKPPLPVAYLDSCYLNLGNSEPWFLWLWVNPVTVKRSVHFVIEMCYSSIISPQLMQLIRVFYLCFYFYFVGQNSVRSWSRHTDKMERTWSPGHLDKTQRKTLCALCCTAGNKEEKVWKFHWKLLCDVHNANPPTHVRYFLSLEEKKIGVVILSGRCGVGRLKWERNTWKVKIYRSLWSIIENRSYWTWTV